MPKYTLNVQAKGDILILWKIQPAANAVCCIFYTGVLNINPKIRIDSLRKIYFYS